MMQETIKTKLCMTSVGLNHIALNSAFTNVILIISKKHLKTSIVILFRGEKQWKKVMFL